MGPGGPGPRFDLPFRLVGAYPAPGPGAIGGCAPPYPAVPFCSHKKEPKMRPGGLPLGTPCGGESVEVKSCECLRTTDSYGVLIYGAS